MLSQKIAAMRPKRMRNWGGEIWRSFLLVHGGLHGAWCWSKLIPHLETRGHEVAAIDMPGLGDDLTPAETTTLDDYGDAVVKGARAMGGDVIAVGHSLGGMSISSGVEKAPELFSKLVYLTAIMLADGDNVSAAGIALDPSITANAVSPITTREVCEYMFYNDCAKADVDDAMARLRPQAGGANGRDDESQPRSLGPCAALLYRVRERQCADHRQSARDDRAAHR